MYVQCVLMVTNKAFLIPLFLYSFIPLFHYSFIPLFLYSFIPLFLYTFIPLVLYSFIPLFLYSFIPSFLHSFIPSFLHSFIPLFLYSFIPLFLYSFIPLFGCDGAWLEMYFSQVIHLRWLRTTNSGPPHWQRPIPRRWIHCAMGETQRRLLLAKEALGEVRSHFRARSSPVWLADKLCHSESCLSC